MADEALSHAQMVGALLTEYAARGVFRGVGDGERRRGKTTFTLRWHYDRQIRLVLDPQAATVCFPALLPEAPARSPMVRELKAFLRRFETDDVPPHRRIDPAKGRLRVAVRAGNVSLGLVVLDDETEYCTRRLVHLAHEVFMVFLPDGPYDAYRVEKLGLDPERAWL